MHAKTQRKANDGEGSYAPSHCHLPGWSSQSRPNSDRAKMLVAVVVPTHRPQLTSDEQISLAHLRRFLGNYDKYLVLPQSGELYLPDFEIKRFDDDFFRSQAANNKLTLSEAFYDEFRDYKYILIYQLDCLVFSDTLVEWCQRGYDYIGAPWFRTPDLPWKMRYLGPDRCGNGGFSLRNVSQCLNALRRSRCLRRRLFSLSNTRGIIEFPQTLSLLCRSEFRKLRHEDLWWSFYAQKILPTFKIPPADVAVSFAFETSPKYCFERNNHNLPFGCHAWNRCDREFWEGYLLTPVGNSKNTQISV